MRKNFKQTIFVNGILHDDMQRVLLVRRSFHDKFLPGYLEFPGGRVREGQSLEECLANKLYNELGIRVDDPLFYRSYGEVNRKGPYIRVVFEVAYDRKQAINISKQHSEHLWIKRNQIDDDKITSDAKKLLLNFLGDKITTPKTTDNVEKTTLTIFTDGGSRGNPGPSASGFVIYDSNQAIVESGGAYIGITTNNQAEYTAVILALRAAKKHATNETRIDFYMDSLMAVNQLNGVYKIKNRELWPLNVKIRQLMQEFASVRFTHINREQNSAADAKVNEILNAHAAK